MKPAGAPVDETAALVAELHRLDVRHLARLRPAAPAEAWPVGRLLAALARHPEARLRSALILVFLRHPEFSRHVSEAVAALDATTASTIKLYYQAAAYLERELEPVLRQVNASRHLPDLFSAELGLPAPSAVGRETQAVNAALQTLGEVQRQHTGQNYNWAGSYRHHLDLFLRQLGARDGSLRP
jgi:hypothetical protein